MKTRSIMMGAVLPTMLLSVLAGGARGEYQSPQPDFKEYRTPLQSRVLDHRFHTGEAMYLASEMNMGGDPFFKTALSIGLPVADDHDFFYMTAVESYWYSRYNMSALVTESRLGLHVVYGPYVAERAIREGRPMDNRDRGEYILANKGEALQRIVPAYQHLTGFPRRFEDASPSMLQFASGDPYYPRRLDKDTNFESPENLARWRELSRYYPHYDSGIPRGMGEGGNDYWKYRINYRENFLTLRWNHDKMDHAVDLGAEGQTLMKLVLWMEYFFQAGHHEGRFIGNNAEEGFRGAMLNLMAVSKMLMLKGTLVYDGKQLHGVDPVAYDPAEGLQYFPHRVNVRMRMVGDLPPRPEEFLIGDASSRLFDQASLLWGLTEYYRFADPVLADVGQRGDIYDNPQIHRNWARVFGEDPPYDGTLMERKYGLLAQSLADMVLANIQAMHMHDGALVSEWSRASGPGTVLRIEDAAMTMLALANYHRRIHVEPDNQAKTADALRMTADFLVSKMKNTDGSFADGFDVAASRKIGDAPTLLAQSMAVRGLLEAYREIGDQKYLDAARAAYMYMNRVLWHDGVGVYRSRANETKSVYTPLNLGATLGAMREMILVTKDTSEIQRFKRFWVQAVDGSGIQQSEYEETGEGDFSKRDGDGDGIPRMEFAGGRFGIAPVYAGSVEIATP